MFKRIVVTTAFAVAAMAGVAADISAQGGRGGAAAGPQKLTVVAESHVPDVEVLRASPPEIPIVLEPMDGPH